MRRQRRSCFYVFSCLLTISPLSVLPLSAPKTASSSGLPDLATQLEYARNGHAVIRNLVDASLLVNLRGKLWKFGKRRELDAWRQKVEVASNSQSLAAACATVEACQHQLVQMGIMPSTVPFLQHFHAWQSIPEVKDLACRLAQVAATLMDVPSLRLYQDSLFWKRPGDGPTPWHTDARMAPFDTSCMMTLWIPLQPIPVDGTALLFCSKSHADFALPYWNPYDVATANDPKSAWNQLENRYGRYSDKHLCVDYMPLALGDVTAHSGWTLHCTNPNVSESEHRLALAITYVDARAPVRSSNNINSNDDVFSAHLADGDAKSDSEDRWSYKDWLPQVPKGSFDWDHALVPIVYPYVSKRKQRRRTIERRLDDKGKQEE
jgi:ectoine hydroxylase-related dioxygenase (phytanoyl-CoA dioxygenase family)